MVWVVYNMVKSQQPLLHKVFIKYWPNIILWT